MSDDFFKVVVHHGDFVNNGTMKYSRGSK